jgi:type I restriction-modification system DNA methylase subunit
MHYLQKAVKDLKQNGFNYYTPKVILDKIKMDSILANPPYKVKE